jgi:Nucleotide modification associated domain 3
VAAFLANVGVNASHAARSPLSRQGDFLLLPIPETMPWAVPMLRMEDLSGASAHVPRRWRSRPVHLDPDLLSPTPTYGDNCRTAGRAFSLRRAQAGDLIVFLARLHHITTGPAFYLVGRLDIEDVLPDLHSDPGPGWWDGNAHVRRARAWNHLWNGFWLFRGGPRSRYLRRGMPFRRQQAESIFGRRWDWPGTRSELQTIAAHTRAVRRLTGAGEDRLRELVVG